MVFDLAVKSFQPLDLLFWVLAAAAASCFARRPLSLEDGLALYTYDRRPREFELGT